MDSNRIEGSWEELKGKAKHKWGNLTDNELTQIGGKKDELMGRIQARYGYSKDKAKEEVENWLASLGPSGESVMAQMNAAKDGAKQVADNFTTAMQKSVEKNPAATLAMVAAVAFVIGAIWRA
ncbi:MAG: CsbD family protein [Hyphomicrobiaceae bacterium]